MKQIPLRLSGIFLLAFAFTACSSGKGPSPAPSSAPAAAPAPAPRVTTPTPVPAASTLRVENLEEGQQIPEDTPTLFRITGSGDVVLVKVSANGAALGRAEYRAQDAQFRFSHVFKEPGDYDLTFEGFAKGKTEAVASVTVRVQILRKAEPAPVPAPQPKHQTSSRLFNPWVLKAVDYLDKHYGLRGYYINGEITHPVPYYNYGTLKPTAGGQTMCVAGVLEVILTAFALYSKETGDHSLYYFLPFQSWSKRGGNSIKSNIWVNAKLHSAGTGDAIAKFGIGEKVKFRDLEPGGFININRTTGTGHAVVFLGFLDKKGLDLPRFSAEVAGFKYFGAQGHRGVGQGGFGIRHAFFSKSGCPNVPFKRDCNVLFSDDSRILNVGQLYAPSEWKKKDTRAGSIENGIEPDALIRSPVDFDGLTTDD